MAEKENTALQKGSLYMTVAALAFIGYALIFLIRNFTSKGFELGVDTLNGISKESLQALNPGVVYYISHLHVATAGFIAATGIAVAYLSWFGVRKGYDWAWKGAVVAPVVGLGVALPMHYFDLFTHDWVTHLGPIYVATLIFVGGAILSFKGLHKK
ncbi:hypothetical protein HY408_00760 [Candidatus Gottesmanbacteria bacterium]|nr:hypothetical protein [Candidatus Gottesmanbacteria bacterium]